MLQVQMSSTDTEPCITAVGSMGVDNMHEVWHQLDVWEIMASAVLHTVGRRKILDFCLICKHANVAAKAFRGAFELCPDVWQVLGVQLLTCASPELGALGRLHQVSRSARDGICRIFSKRGLLSLLNARQRSNFVYQVVWPNREIKNSYNGIFSCYTGIFADFLVPLCICTEPVTFD